LGTPRLKIGTSQIHQIGRKSQQNSFSGTDLENFLEQSIDVKPEINENLQGLTTFNVEAQTQIQAATGFLSQLLHHETND
jgi:hypothetical protein